MLSRIHVRNLVIVRDLDMAFGPGMTALTGETGAGKSILIDALGLALGDKAGSGLIRAGADRAEVNAAFDLAQHAAALAWLDAHDLGADGECLLRRVLVRDGRSRAYVNGSPVTLQLLRELGEQLIDIQGQHAHQSLLHAPAQRERLDEFAGHGDQVRRVRRLHRDWQSARQAREALQQAATDRASRLDYLEFQLAELDGIGPDADDVEGLAGEQARLAHAERLLTEGARLLALLGDDEASAQSLVERARRELEELSEIDPALQAPAALLETAAIQIDETIGALRRYGQRVELDPERLQQVDRLLGAVHDLARKHRVAPHELRQLRARLAEEAEDLRRADSRLAQLDDRVEKAEAAYHRAARRLSEARTGAAARLSDSVTASMQSLGMQGGRFRVDCRPDGERPGPAGLDRIAFRVAANPGQPEGALSEVASGGELSRIGLAIQVATAGCGDIPTLIFDEVDAGIGGATAEVVGRLLRRLGSGRQVLSVTHLAQVAAQAHDHLRVHKTSDGRTTETRIDRLDASARTGEIARMLGGVDITEQTRRHAAEMIERAQEVS